MTTEAPEIPCDEGSVNAYIELSSTTSEAAPHDDNKSSEKSFNFIKIVNQTNSSIVLQWEYKRWRPLTPDDDTSENIIVFKIIKLCRDSWEAISWGRKQQVTIKNLEQNVCYRFQILVLAEMEQQFTVIDSSHIFKCSIQVVPSQKTFIRAIQKSQLNLIKSCLDMMPDYLSLTSKSHSALSLAVINNDLIVAKYLLERGANVNIGIPNLNRPPLHLAIFLGFLEMADLLISFQAEIRARDILGLNVAHHAIDANKLNAVEYCIEKLGIHTETRDNCGYTLLLRAIVSRASLDIVRYLLDCKASQSVRDNNKMSVLYHVRMINDDDLIEILQAWKPKSRTDVKQKLRHNVQKLIMSRQMQKEETDDEAIDDSSQAISAFEQNILFK